MNGVMMDIAQTSSGKTHRDENFPVASFLIAPRHRAPILAFYDFVRAADDISDHATLAPQEKLDLLDRLDAALMGKGAEERRSPAGCAKLAASGGSIRSMRAISSPPSSAT